MAVRGEAAELVERAGAGITCTPGDPEAIVRALIALRDAGPAGRSRMGLAGRRFYDEKLSLDAGVEQFDLIFRAVRATPHSLPDSRG